MLTDRNFKILDCSLRDGGYYTNWDFSDYLVEEYCVAMENLPVDYVEIGYRSIPLNGYSGKYFYCPDYVIEKLGRLMPSKQLVIILNEKDIRCTDISEGFLDTCKPYISMIRLAVDPKNILRAISLAETIKATGFKVAFNVMYMSTWKEDPSFIDELSRLENILEYFYMVDSFGGVMPSDVKEIIQLIKSKTSLPLGFHGHNNLELALINTLTAINEGCDVVDSTVSGIGRGAGNLRTELLLTYLESARNIKVSYRYLSRVVDVFEKLREEYNWGTSLPYMFSGVYSLPQKQVMEWVGLNRYPLGHIINALKNQKEKWEDNIRLPELDQSKTYSKAIIIGGGKSARDHKVAVAKFLINSLDKIAVIHAGVRNVKEYSQVNVDQYFALVGSENENDIVEISKIFTAKVQCVYPPYPRALGTSITDNIVGFSKELKAISFTNATHDSPLAIAIQIALDLGASELFLVGFDGYDFNINQNQLVIAKENQQVIDDALKLDNIRIKTITPSKYQNLDAISLYSFL